LFSCSQFGFRPGPSTIKALDNVITHISDCFEDKKSTEIILLGLKRAFDTISHEILLEKLFA